MLPRFPASLLAAALPLLCSASLSLAADPSAEWPTFRGTQRTAVSPETGLLQEWPKDGPALVWKADGAGRMAFTAHPIDKTIEDDRKIAGWVARYKAKYPSEPGH